VPEKHLGCEQISGISNICAALKDGRVIVASFFLPCYKWHLFSAFFRENPSAILTRYHFQLDTRRERDFPPELRDVEGHTLVITGFGENAKNGKVVLRLKNSWGEDFADKGYFKVEYDALEFDRFTDVFYRVDLLTRLDISNYLIHLIVMAKGVNARVVDGQSIKVRGCGSYFKFDQSMIHQSKTAKEQEAIAKIHKALNEIAGVQVSGEGEVSLSGSKYTFYVTVLSRIDDSCSTGEQEYASDEAPGSASTSESSSQEDALDSEFFDCSEQGCW